MIIRFSPCCSLILTLPLLSLLLQICFLATPGAATSDDKKDAPSISKYKFDLPPADHPFYFEDSDVILVPQKHGTILRSDDAGVTFTPIPDVPQESGFKLYLHEFDKQTALLWGQQNTHYITHNRGKSWKDFTISGLPIRDRPIFTFHAGDPNKIIVNVCSSLFLCDEMAWYTLDAFETPVKQLRESTRGCVFARSTSEWGMNYIGGEDDKGIDSEDRIVCVATGRFVSFPPTSQDNRLVVSDNYFEDEEEPILELGRTVQGIVNIAVVKGFLIAAASAAKTDELALYVTDDAKQWHRAIFPKDHRLEENAYTVLESTNYSIQVDVMTTPSPLSAMGSLFTSNSNGTYFTRNIEHTNRDLRGVVDFEKVSGIQGIVLVNVVDNWEDVAESPLSERRIKSKISFDDGRTFQKLSAHGDELHLHSVTDLANMGRVYSSKAPGLIMGVGNTGKALKKYEDGDTWVSDDAGVTWSKALEDAHKYEFGDRGAVLLAIYDEGPTDEIQYSINHGKTWQKADLGDKVKPLILTTTPDSTSLKFFLMGSVGEGEELEHYAFNVDFEDYHKGGKCGEKDFEKWYARVDDKGEPTCIMGHKQWYRRRKPDSECFVDKEFEDPVPEYERCACADEDFECDYDFVRSEDGKDCVPVGAIDIPPDVCENEDDKFMGPSGFRLIPGNDCDLDPKGAVDRTKEIERSCKGSSKQTKPPASGEITSKMTTFDSSSIAEYHYLERSDRSPGDDETVVMRTTEGSLHITKDGGKTWKQLFKDEKITSILPHSFRNDVVFFLTGGKKVHYTYNRGQHFGHFKAPEIPTEDAKVPKLSFHPNYKDWLIWTGGVNCKSNKGQCHNVAFFSEDRGANWEHRLRYVGKCEFINEAGRGDENKLLYCEQYKDESLDQPLQLKWSNNWFADENEVFGDIIDFATMSEFIVVAARKEDDHDALSCHTSVDGKTFALAQFPPAFDVPTQKAYTVLESKSHAVFLHVTVNNMDGSEYGSIIKSNSNGTSYVMSLSGVNRNRQGYVDFEKMDILEGVMLANVVLNVDEANEGKDKRLGSVITHNDGSQWAPIQAPAKDEEGNSFDCDTSNVEKCSLHLHSFTERRDKRATFSSKSAIGLMMGVGNVGAELQAKSDGDTFMTRDGGIEWYQVKKGNYMWEYGDQGSIIVIVAADVPTKSVFYTRNEGIDWDEYEFSEKEHLIASISTIPSDQSRNFILWSSEDGGEIATFNLDFTGLTDQMCKLNENNPNEGDYYLWEPRHPKQRDNCLFGHKAQYHRKKLEANCYNGPTIEKLHSVSEDCACVREDFECDYNYEISNEGTCVLSPGASPPDHSQQCKDNPDLKFFFEPTGYRRTPLDSCKGGKELEYSSRESACPGYEPDLKEKQRSKGLGGFWFFVLVFVLPVAIAGSVGYWVYQHWDGKFGRIRLGDGGMGGGSGGAMFDADQPWIKYPIMGISALVAVAAAVPLVVGSVWRSVLGMFGRGGGYGRVDTYRSRSDFSRGGRYAVMDPEEDELFGDDDDEEPAPPAV